MQEEKRDDVQHTPVTDPSVEPTIEEVDARQSRETEQRLASVDQGAVSEALLARIEPEGRELYNINQNLEGALLLSIAISLCTSAAVPVAAREEDISDYRTAYPDDEPASNPPRKAKSVLRKVGVSSRAGTISSKSGGGKASKGRSDKSTTSRASAGVRHWDRPASRKGRK
jgi:hypothetical protein